MIRYLLAAAAIGWAAMQFTTDTQTALAYGLVAAPVLLLLLAWTRRQRSTKQHHPTPSTAPAPQLTQINHYHYYSAHPGQIHPAYPPANPHQLGLPQHSATHAAHDRIYGAVIDEQ